jgi:predicted tellurium resistance membrane protein TerC
MIKRLFILLTYAFLGGITGIQKIMGEFPPKWYIDKYSATLINWVPGGVMISFLIIVLLELAIASLFVLALLKGEFKESQTPKFAKWGFMAALLLFLILFFGSFIAQSYDNGFMDFGYFAFTIYLMSFFEKAKE